MECASCHATIPEDSRFCPSCGGKAVPAMPPFPSEERRDGRGTPLLFYVGFGLLFLIAAGLFWGGGVSVVGWVVLAVCAGAVFVIRSRMAGASMFLGVAAWAGVLVVLFLTLGLTAESKGSAVGGASGAVQPTAGTAAANATRPSATSGAANPAAKPTATVLKGGPPDALKPLLTSLGKQPDKVDYTLTQDGDSSSAWMAISVRGPVVNLPNFSGDTAWNGTISFQMNEAWAKSAYQSQVKSAREDQGFNDAAKAFLPRVESSPGQGDESASFIRAWKDQPLASMRVHVLRQGATYVYISTQGETKNPLVAGDGLDLMVTELKKLDNKTLQKWLPGTASSSPQPTAAKPAATATVVPQPKPTAAPAASSGLKVQNAVAGTSIDNTQKIASPSNVFKPNTPEIAFSAEVSNVSQEAAVDIQLTYLPTGDSIKGPTQKLSPAQGISRVGFVFSQPTAGWPAGQFKATFFLNGQDAGSVNFSVQ